MFLINIIYIPFCDDVSLLVLYMANINYREDKVQRKPLKNIQCFTLIYLFKWKRDKEIDIYRRERQTETEYLHGCSLPK